MEQTKDLDRKLFLEENIGKLLFRFSAPTTLAMLMITLYTIIDTIFVGHFVGTDALAGLTIVLPIMMLFYALMLTVGVGGSSIWSVDMGAKNFDRAHKVFCNSIFLSLVAGLIIILINIFLLDTLLALLGTPKEAYIYAKTFTRILLFGAIISNFVETNIYFIRSEGKAITAMALTIIAVITNIILDYVFIVKLNMSVAGAALGIICSDSLLTIIILLQYFYGKSQLRPGWGIFKPDFGIITEIIKIGAASFVRQVTIGFKQFILNSSVMWYAPCCVSTYLAIIGISLRVILIVLVPIFGILTGMQPIIGFNYGAKSYQRVRKTIIISIVSCTAIASVIWIIFLVHPEWALMMFSKDKEVLDKGSNIVRFIVGATPFIAAQATGGAIFQPLKKPLPAMFFALLRQFILLLPLILILPRFLGFNGIFYAVPIADVLAFVITIIWVIRELKILDKKALESTPDT